MALNHPYDPRHNPKIYIPKLTEEQRLAWVTPLENLKGLRFRTETPAAPVTVPTPVESLPPAPAPQDTVALQDVPVPAPAPDYIPTALEVVQAELPEISTQGDNRENIEHDDEHRVANARHRANGHGGEHAHHTEANIASAPDPPSTLAYEEDDILAYANVVSFYSRPRRNATAPKAARQRSGGLRSATPLIPHHSSG
jgi:hypothetical protein